MFGLHYIVCKYAFNPSEGNRMHVNARFNRLVVAFSSDSSILVRDPHRSGVFWTKRPAVAL